MKRIYLLIPLIVSDDPPKVRNFETICDGQPCIETDKMKIVFGAPGTDSVENYQKYHKLEELSAPEDINQICEVVKSNFTGDQHTTCFKYEDQYMPCFKCEFTSSYMDELKSNGSDHKTGAVQVCGTTAFEIADTNGFSYSYGTCRKIAIQIDTVKEYPIVAIIGLILLLLCVFIGSCIYGHRLIAKRRKKNRQGRQAGGVYEEEAF